MAAAQKKPTKKSSSSRVTRITAKDDSSARAPKTAKKASTKSRQAHKLTPEERVAAADETHLDPSSYTPSRGEVAEQKREKVRARSTAPLRALKEYFTGAWYELRQVRWPNRSTSIEMTAALLGFTGLFVLVIILLDTGFQYMFEQIIK